MKTNTAADAVKTALDAILYLPNGVASWEEAHGGNKVLAKENAEKLAQAEKLMSEVLASMPKGKTYFVVGVGRFDTESELIAALTKLGIKHTGVETNTRLRTELVGAPTFNKLIGPIYDGPGVCRYETQEVYDQLSR